MLPRQEISSLLERERGLAKNRSNSDWFLNSEFKRKLSNYAVKTIYNRDVLSGMELSFPAGRETESFRDRRKVV